MIPILAPTPRSDRRILDLVGVTRVLAVPTDRLASTVAALEPGTTVHVDGRGRLELEAPFEPGPAPGRWRTRARLHPRGARLVPRTRVEVELSPWSDRASDVHVRPVARAPHAWGVRRLRRYLAFAPLATEALVRHLEACSPATVPVPLVAAPRTPGCDPAGCRAA